MTLSEILASMTSTDGVWTATVPDTWLQGRSAFGGLQSAIALQAMRALVPNEVPLRVMQTTFIAPVPPGEVRVAVNVLRKGKNVVHVEARLMDGTNVLCIVIGIFGSTRASRVRVSPERPRDAPSSEPVELPFVPGFTPSFLQNFRSRWLGGALPFTSATESGAVMEVSAREDGRLTEAHALAIADVPPPMALALLDSPAPGSSLTWTLEMLTTGAALATLPLGGFRLDCELVAGGDGYTSQSVMVWGPGGQPVALSRQSMVVFG